MEFFPPFHKIKERFRKSKWIGIGIFIAWFIWEAIKHSFFEWFNKQLVREASPVMQFLGAIIKWTLDNSISLLAILLSIYSLFVIIGAYISSALILKFGVYWDKKYNPICPNCKTPLSMSGAGSNILRCLKCKEDINLRDGDTFYPLNDAIKAVKSLKTGKSILEISKAEYWTLTARMDVTEKVRNLVVDGKLAFTVLNEILGVDPDPGTRKILTIEYKLSGITKKMDFKEREEVILPQK